MSSRCWKNVREKPSLFLWCHFAEWIEMEGKMRKEEKVRICDVCKKKVTDSGETMFGGSVFNGWFRLEITAGGTALRDTLTQTEWDICGKDCLKKLVEERLK